MAGTINGLADALLALIIIGVFVLFVYAKIMKKKVGEVFSSLIGFFTGDSDKSVIAKEETKQVWNQRKTIM